MAIELRPTSELEAVNMMLASIGESPVNTIEDSGVVDAVTARQMLTSTSRRVQAKGWHWNTDKCRMLPLSFPDREVTLPLSCLKVDTVGNSQSLDCVQRGTRLYDRKNHSYTFASPVYVDMVQMLAFDELPETARAYITLSAARKFQESFVGSEVLSSFNQRDEMMAWMDLVNEEGETADYNILTSVAGVLSR